MNLVILTGRLTGDPETRTAQTGTKVVRYCLAVQGIKETNFIDCVCFGKVADFAEKYLKKGTKITITGSIKVGFYEKDGRKIKTTDIIVNTHEFCETKKNTTEANTTKATAEAETPSGFYPVDDEEEDDLPF